MPSVLLIGTLYRLALNVSSTRLILLQADAGRVIRAFGDFLVRGDYIVGAVIFLIVSLIQYVVVAKGGERVAEVAARFALDAMPGKQLAIDADLRAGGLRVEAAQARRAELERESRFYGAMDGAMKFVKGDAIASLIITSVAFIGGTAVGVWNRGLSFEAALKLYGLLAIGDGLVSQLPALITSTAAGLVVTRVAEQAAGSLGADVASQLFERPRTLFAVAAALGMLAIVPGLPAAPFAVLALLSAARGLLTLRAQPAHADPAPPTLLLELGPQLSAAANQGRAAALKSLFESQLAAIAGQLDVPVPTWRCTPNARLASQAFVLSVRQAPCLRGNAENLAELTHMLERELRPLLERRARELLALETVQHKLDELARWAPTLVQSVVPRLFTLAQLTEILRRLLDERVGLQALERIFEALSQCEREAVGSDRGLELARRALRESLCEAQVPADVLYVHALDPLIEDTLRDATRAIAGERVVALAPELAGDIVQAVRKVSALHAQAPVLVTQAELRRSLFDILRDDLPEVTVLAYSELPNHLAIERRELITIA
jgi:type III secretory pathway component EscV